jgi:hypothetical protein
LCFELRVIDGCKEYSSADRITAGLATIFWRSTIGKGLVVVTGSGTIFVVEPKARGAATPFLVPLVEVCSMSSRGPGSGTDAATAVVGLVSAIGGILSASVMRGGSDFAAAACRLGERLTGAFGETVSRPGERRACSRILMNDGSAGDIPFGYACASAYCAKCLDPMHESTSLVNRVTVGADLASSNDFDW